MDASEWAGDVGDAWAAEWRRTDRTFRPVDDALVTAVVKHLAGQSAPRVLDVGCGAGTTALNIAARIAGAQITGIDLSPALLAIARERSVNQPRCRFITADASSWIEENRLETTRPAGFDLIVSRHGVMFFDDPVSAFRHLRTLAKPAASLIFTCFRAARFNTWSSAAFRSASPPTSADPHTPGPFSFAEPERVYTLLTQSGWRGAAGLPVDYAYVAGSGRDPSGDAIDFLSRIGPSARVLRSLDEADRKEALARLEAVVATHLTDGRVAFPGAAWIWTGRA